jgi:hypothetical protein
VSSTRAEAIAALGKFVAKPLISADADPVALHAILDGLGAAKLFAERKLQHLVVGAKPGRGWVSFSDHGPIGEIQKTAAGLYSDRLRHGESYIKAADYVRDPRPEQLPGLRANRSARNAILRARGQPAGVDDGPIPLGLGAFTVQHPEFADLTATLTHEFGHAVHLETFGKWGEIDHIVQARFDAIDREPISTYAQENSREYFAESYAAYQFRRAEMRTAAPKAFRMVEEVLRLRGLL